MQIGTTNTHTASKRRDRGRSKAEQPQPAAIRFAVGACSLGSAAVAMTGTGICAIVLGDDADAVARDIQERFPDARRNDQDKDVQKLLARAVAAIESPRRAHDLPLDVRGTAFQVQVWRALAGIPAGSTASYAEIAKKIGAPKAVRAVAQACAANPVAVIVPCHRVVRSDGAMSGYRWGVERKRTLLQREQNA